MSPSKSRSMRLSCLAAVPASNLMVPDQGECKRKFLLAYSLGRDDLWTGIPQKKLFPFDMLQLFPFDMLRVQCAFTVK